MYECSIESRSCVLNFAMIDKFLALDTCGVGMFKFGFCGRRHFVYIDVL